MEVVRACPQLGDDAGHAGRPDRPTGVTRRLELVLHEVGRNQLVQHGEVAGVERLVYQAGELGERRGHGRASPLSGVVPAARVRVNQRKSAWRNGPPPLVVDGVVEIDQVGAEAAAERRLVDAPRSDAGTRGDRVDDHDGVLAGVTADPVGEGPLLVGTQPVEAADVDDEVVRRAGGDRGHPRDVVPDERRALGDAGRAGPAPRLAQCLLDAVHADHGPPLLGEPDRVPTGAAAGIQRHPRGTLCDHVCQGSRVVVVLPPVHAEPVQDGVGVGHGGFLSVLVHWLQYLLHSLHCYCDPHAGRCQDRADVPPGAGAGHP